MPAVPKPRPLMAERDARTAQEQAFDRAESQKVRKRSRGRCEVTIGGVRCDNRASEVHHHIGGWKLRGRGDSALAAHKTHACSSCHRYITGNVYRHVNGNRYEWV